MDGERGGIPGQGAAVLCPLPFSFGNELHFHRGPAQSRAQGSSPSPLEQLH